MPPAKRDGPNDPPPEMEGEQTPADWPPTSSWGVILGNSETRFRRVEGGGMLLTFNPVELTDRGLQLVSPLVQIGFSPEGWARFKEEVARDGIKSRVKVPLVVVPSGAGPAK